MANLLLCLAIGCSAAEAFAPCARAHATAVVRAQCPRALAGFFPRPHATVGRLRLPPLRAAGGGDGSSDPAVFNRLPGESEIKTFLTQRALQNLVSLLLLQRDQVMPRATNLNSTA
jgi:hypothetical protein